MSYSFLNPVVDGKIWSPGEGQIDLSLIGENKIPYVNGVELSVGMGGNTEMTIHLRPTYEEAVRMVDEEPWFRLGNTLAIRWGYNDGQPGHISDWYYGFMQVPEVSFGEEITVDIKATGFGWNMTWTESNRVYSSFDNPRPFNEVADEIAAKYGMIVEWKGAVWDARTEEALFAPRPDLIQAGLTDFQFLERFSRLNSTGRGVYMYIYRDRIIFASNPKESVPAAEFHMYGRMDPANNIFPMFEFNPESLGPLFLPHRTYAAINFGPNSDPEAEVEVVESAGDKDAGESAAKENFYSGKETIQSTHEDGPVHPDVPLKSDVAQDPQEEAGKIVPISLSGDTTREQVRSTLDNVRQGDAEFYGISVQFSSVGIPTLLPEQIVRLRGVTDFFSTDYQIKSLEISIGDGGADMSINGGAHGLSEGMATFSKAVDSFVQGETEPGDGGEDVEANSGAGE